MPRARPQPHVRAPGHAGERRLAPALGRRASRTSARDRRVGSVCPGANCPPVQRAPRLAASGAAATPPRARPAPREVLADAHAEPALEASRSGTGSTTRPPPRGPTEQRVGQLELAHQRMLHVACSIAARAPPARRGRAGSGRSPRRRRSRSRGVRAAPAHDARERQRAGLRTDDVEAGRLGDDAGVVGGVALQRGERAEAAVLLGGDGTAGRVAARGAAAARPARAAPRPRRPSCRARRGRAGSRPRPRPTTGRVRHGAVPGADDVDMAAEGEPRRRRGRAGATVSDAQLVARRPPRPGWPGSARSAARSWRRSCGSRPSAAAQLPEPLERRALVARHARDCASGGVARERLGVESGVGDGLGGGLGVGGGACGAPHGVGERAHVGDPAPPR